MPVFSWNPYAEGWAGANPKAYLVMTGPQLNTDWSPAFVIEYEYGPLSYGLYHHADLAIQDVTSAVQLVYVEVPTTDIYNRIINKHSVHSILSFWQGQR